MKKILFYGLGKVFAHSCNTDFMRNLLRQGGYHVVGVSDTAIQRVSSVLWGGTEIPVVRIEDLLPEAVAYAVITTGKPYWDEIRTKLEGHGFLSSQILTFQDLRRQLMTYVYPTELYAGKRGVEIGGPSASFSYIYSLCGRCDGVNFCADTVWWTKGDTKAYLYEDQPLGSVYIADATALHCIQSGSYDFCLSSNNLEHIANPIKALKEMCRILKPHGSLTILVPCKERTFDHNRQVTFFEHMLADYLNDVGEDDLSHLPEIILRHDYEMDAACGGRERFIQRAQSNYANRCLHHHVFDEKCLRQLFSYLHIDVVKFMQMDRDYLIIGQV